jgi:hypothetical protein
MEVIYSERIGSTLCESMMGSLWLPLFVVQVRTDRLHHALKYFIQQLYQDNGPCHKSRDWGGLTYPTDVIQFLLQVKWTGETDVREFNKTRIRNLFQDVSQPSCFFRR